MVTYDKLGDSISSSDLLVSHQAHRDHDKPADSWYTGQGHIKCRTVTQSDLEKLEKCLYRKTMEINKGSSSCIFGGQGYYLDRRERTSN